MRILTAELFKLKRLRITLVLLAVMAVIEILMIAGMSYWAMTSPDAAKIPPEERKKIAMATSFPASIPSTLSFVATLGPLCAVILAARLGGDEYSWGTAKQLVSMGLDRRKYVIAKLAAVVLASLILLAGAVVAGTIISLVVTLILGRPLALNIVTASFLGEIARGVGIAWLSLGFYSVLTLLLAILTRSATTATATGILLFLLEGNLVGFLASKFPLVARIAPYTIGQNVTSITSLIEQGARAQAPLPPEALRSFVVLAVWLVVFVACSVWVFSRQELGVD